MEQSSIIDFIKSNFSNGRISLVPLLQKFNWENSPLSEIYSRLMEDIEMPMNVRGNMNDEQIEKLKKSEIDTDALGDISDFYTIVLNPEIEEVDDWDFADLINQNKEIQHCRVWINWFLPVYYIETNYEKGSEDGKFIQYGPLNSLTDFQHQIVEKVKEILSSYNYTSCSLDFLTQRIPGAKTDLVNENASAFDCLFSDFSYFWNTHIRRNNRSIKDPLDDKVTVGLWEYLDDNFAIIKKERTLYYNGFGYVTIISDKDHKVTEVICRDYAGNEELIQIGNNYLRLGS